jgi:hypothetical protein
MDFGVVIVTFVVIAIVVRLLAGGMDGDRVRAYIEERGGRLLSSDWAPFGKGWFGERSDRIYEVRYLDSDGNEHHAHCKTSMFTGVYFTEDRIVRYSERPSEESEDKVRLSVLEREIRRLRDELQRAKDRKRLIRHSSEHA